MIARVLLSCLLWSNGSLSGQNPAPSPSVPEWQTQGAFWAVVVADLAVSERWYSENLGLHRIKKGRAPSGIVETSVMEGHGMYVEFVHFLDGKINPLAQVGPKDGQHLAIGVFKTGITIDAIVFDRLLHMLQQRRVEFVGGVFDDKEMGVRSFIVKDNTGNLLQFFAKLGGQK